MNSGRPTWHRPPLTRGVKALLAINLAVFLVELAVAYALDFDQNRMSDIFHWLGLSLDDVARGRIWQLLSYMWIHDPDHVLHIGFNLLVLFFFGPSVEQRWQTNRFLRHYLAYGLGGGLFYLLTGVVSALLFGHRFGTAIGASGAIAGVVTAYCLLHWRQTLSVFFFQLSGRGLLIAFVVIDLVRVLYGERIAVQAHWGGMLTAALLLGSDRIDPRRIWWRLVHWRRRRRMRLHREDSGQDSWMLH